MEEFSIDLEKLKLKPEDDVNAVRINIIVQAIKENKRAIIENMRAIQQLEDDLKDGGSLFDRVMKSIDEEDRRRR